MVGEVYRFGGRRRKKGRKGQGDWTGDEAFQDALDVATVRTGLDVAGVCRMALAARVGEEKAREWLMDVSMRMGVLVANERLGDAIAAVEALRGYLIRRFLTAGSIYAPALPGKEDDDPLGCG